MGRDWARLGEMDRWRQMERDDQIFREMRRDGERFKDGERWGEMGRD